MDTTALFKLGYGLYVIGTELDGATAGCTANTVMQITSDPAQIAVGLNKNNYTNEMIQKSGKLTVSILSKTADMDLLPTLDFRAVVQLINLPQADKHWRQTSSRYLIWLRIPAVCFLRK